MANEQNPSVPNDVPGPQGMSKRQFLKGGLRGAGISAIAWYVVPAIEVLLTPAEGGLRAGCNPPCGPNQCTPLIQDCGPVFCSPTGPCVP
jgi:hypothetical protein